MKIKVILIILILLSISLTGCREELQNKIDTSLNDISKEKMGFDTYETNPEVCTGLEEVRYADMCYNIVAINTKNSTYCEKIQDGLIKQSCPK